MNHAQQNAHLVARNRELRRQITLMRESAEQRNRQLVALHWVRCSCPCPHGLPLDEEVVRLAERNTARLRAKWENQLFRGAWMRVKAGRFDLDDLHRVGRAVARWRMRSS